MERARQDTAQGRCGSRQREELAERPSWFGGMVSRRPCQSGESDRPTNRS